MIRINLPEPDPIKVAVDAALFLVVSLALRGRQLKKKRAERSPRENAPPVREPAEGSGSADVLAGIGGER